MNYKDSISLFRTQIDIEQFNRKAPVMVMTDKQVMVYLSMIQNQLQRNYLLYEKSVDITLKAGICVYDVGTNAYNIPSDIYRIKNVSIPNQYPDLIGISKDQMLASEKELVITKYCYYGTNENAKLEINAKPLYDYGINYPNSKLVLKYYPAFSLFDSKAGTTNATFPIPNGTLPNEWSEAVQDGEWLLPPEWHDLIISGGVALIFKDLKKEWIMECERMTKDDKIDLSLTYKIGI